MITICDRVTNFPAVLAVAQAHNDIWCSVGTHPHEAKDSPQLKPEELIQFAAHPKVVGIGETGLDFFYDLSPRDVQAAVFRAHIAAARETQLPLIVHSRDADAQMADILERAGFSIGIGSWRPECNGRFGRWSLLPATEKK